MTPGDASISIDECEVDGGACPGAVGTICRVDVLLAKAQLCEVDDDCTMFTFPPNCLQYGKCPVAVSFRREAQFSIDATRELNAFCRAAACQLTVPCVPDRRTPRSDCLNGRCVLVFGSGDAGVDGGGGDAGP